jgi:hypothetical protein
MATPMLSDVEASEEGPPSKSSRNWELVLHAAVIYAPVIIFASIIIWFSQNRISPNPAVEASATNPLGLLTSNFVYDGSTNIENIVLSSVSLLIISFYLPKKLRVFMVCLLPFIAVAAGGLAELTAIASAYLSLPLCARSCSFYGMSAVSNAMVGFTFAGFFISFRLIILQRRKRELAIKRTTWSRGGIRLPSQAILASAFVIYVLLLLLFVGVIAIPSSPSSSSPSSSSTPSPPTIFTQTPPVALVHSASLAYGFLFCFATFVLVNRRYHVFVSPVQESLD